MKKYRIAALLLFSFFLTSCDFGPADRLPGDSDPEIGIAARQRGNAEAEAERIENGEQRSEEKTESGNVTPGSKANENDKRSSGPYFRVNTEEKVIALTFDDGPHPRYTDKILDLLEKYQAKATFFVIGKNLELYASVTKRVFEAGHEIGNHTYDHPTLSCIGPSELSRQIEKNEKLIESITGKKSLCFRPPEGFCGRYVREVINKKGYQAILWDVDTRDWAGTPSKTIVKNVLKSVHPGAIILFHDYVGEHNTTVEALREILAKLSEEGYRFITVSELLSYGPDGSSAPSSGG